MTDHPIQYRNTFVASGTGNSFSFSGTSVGLAVIGTGTAVLEHTNTPDISGSWATLATQAATGFASASTERAFGRVVVTGEATVAVSCAGAKTGAGGGAGGGDASAANQGAQITAADLTNARIGATDSAAAASDTADAPLSGLFKRFLQRLTSLWTQGTGTSATALRVTLATDGAGVASLTSIDGQYARIIDEVDATTTYECEAAPGTAAGTAAWRCKRIVRSGTVTTITWAGGAAFNQIASNRASLTYA